MIVECNSCTLEQRLFLFLPKEIDYSTEDVWWGFFLKEKIKTQDSLSSIEPVSLGRNKRTCGESSILYCRKAASSDL